MGFLNVFRNLFQARVFGPKQNNKPGGQRAERIIADFFNDAD